VVALEQLESKVKELDSLKKVVLYCSLHKGKELELYCETCEELICHNCTVKKHKDHQYDLVDDTFEKHKAEIVASLGPVENQLGIANEALQQIEQRSGDVNEQRVATKTEIQKVIQQLHEMLEARKVELMGKVDEYADQKVKNLAAQKDEVETVQTQLASCLSFVRESLRTGSQGEVMKMKKTVVKQIKEMTDHFDPDKLIAPYISQEKCYATGEGIELAIIGKPATVILHTIDYKGEAFPTSIETIVCEFVSLADDKKTKCSLEAVEPAQFEVSYQATSRGRHQLHIKVEGEHIKGSPFTVTVKLPVKKLGTPVRVIGGLSCPWGVAVNQRGEIIVVEYSGNHVSIFSPTGEKLRSFGSQGSGQGQFSCPRGVAVDDDGNILVVDSGNNRVQKFTSDGKFVVAVGKDTVNLNISIGISIHSINKKVIVSDHSNHCIQVLNPNLTFSKRFGGEGTNDGQTTSPYEVAFDSAGKIYQVGNSTTGVQVFTADGQFLRKFGHRGSGQRKLNFPSGIAIDSNDVVYVAEYYSHCISVFTTEGAYLTSFGTPGNGKGQFSTPVAIIVDNDGFIYVSDYSNGRIQVF
jgi:tripartite motif-containing protein 2/3/tripartite motif-containing protein 71